MGQSWQNPLLLRCHWREECGMSSHIIQHTTAHPLDQMLKPQSVALVGASSRPDSSGFAMVQMSRIDGYSGRIYPVNPNYAEVDGLRCYESLATLPETVDLVAIAV